MAKPDPPDDAAFTPELSQDEAKDVGALSAVRAHVVHEAIRREGDEELERPSSALAFSGLAAGLSMGFSLVGEGLLRAHLPDAPWRPLIVKLGYSLGFLVVILGRQQLFTENTLTGVIPLLARRDRGTLLNVMRLWVVVLAANLIGALLFAFAIGRGPIFDADIHQAFQGIGFDSLRTGFDTTLVRGIFAGWLIALLVWMMPAAHSSRAAIIIIITYVVSLGRFPHVIAGSLEVLYLVVIGQAGWGQFLGGYFLPTLIGNIIGGVALVSAVNHAQVMAGK